VDLTTLPTVAMGAACDPLGLENACMSSAPCVAAAGATMGTCTGLAAAQQAACAVAEVPMPFVANSGATRARTASLFEGSCAKQPGSPERLFHVELTARADLLAWALRVDAAFDPVLYLRGGQDACQGDDAELVCADDDPTRADRSAQLIGSDLMPGTYYLVL